MVALYLVSEYRMVEEAGLRRQGDRRGMIVSLLGLAGFSRRVLLGPTGKQYSA